MTSSTRRKVGSGPLISPHPLAPLYEEASHENQLLLFRQAIEEVTSPNLDTSNEEVRELIRQTGFVNLWFFLRFVASYSGPYDLLNPDLHLDMANFYQLAMIPGSKGAGFIFRGGYKSSIWTHGANTWEVLRNPNIEIVLASNIFERSLEFLGYSQETIKENPVFKWLYPEWVPDEGRSPNWDKKSLMVPCKKRARSRPNIKLVSVGGSVQGVHGDLFKIDDLIGEHMLNADRTFGADMVKATNWGKAAVKNIPKANRVSRTMVFGTRYGPDDGYTWIWDDICEFWGYQIGEPYQVKPDGEWTVYYRGALEEDDHGEEHVTMPEKWTIDELKKLEKDDPWTYWTQVMNRSTYSGLSEFSEYEPKPLYVERDPSGRRMLRWRWAADEYMYEQLRNMDLVMAVDPAGLTKERKLRSSRTAVVVYARHWKGYRFILEAKAGFVPPSEWVEWLFDFWNRYKMDGLRMTCVEMMGGFSILQDTIRQAEKSHGINLRVRPTSASGDKAGRIRMGLQHLFEEGMIYATEQSLRPILEEMKNFPNGRIDTLDALLQAESNTVSPEDPDDEEYEHEERLLRRATVNPTTGY